MLTWWMLDRVSELSWLRAPSDRRFKEALEAPFWTTLDPYILTSLWQALGHPSSFLALPVVPVSNSVQ